MSRTDTAATRTSGASLELRGLVKRYGAETAVDGVDLRIEPGEFVSLLGPSGSGKTTTLNMIAGFAEVTAGDVLLDGSPIADLPPHKRGIGVVFQHYALFPHMTAADNVEFPLKRRRMPKAQRRRSVQEALELVRLGDFGGRYPRELSGGQQQRVAVARALVFGPRVLLMDEPLGALDKKLREWLQLEIKRLHRELGITFVYVTHDQEEALALSDRIAVFNEGRIEQLGTAEDLYERPRTLFCAQFLGESNVFPGVVREDGDGVRLAGDGFELRVVGEEDVPAGSGGAVVVRPEHMRLCRDGDTPADGDNVLAGCIEQVVYLGSARRVELRLTADQRAVVREPAASARGLGEGDEVVVCWSPADSVLVPEQALRREEVPAPVQAPAPTDIRRSTDRRDPR